MKLEGKRAAVVATTATSAAIYCYYIRLGLRTPLPGRGRPFAEGLDVEKHEFVTADGLTLRLKRYLNPGGVPVLLCHGFGSCGSVFDLPEDRHNMAVFLARRGFDVWISSWRGCGRAPYDSEGGDWTHTIDDLAVYDAPALVDGVARATGKRPFWIGHSMGGHILYMYLQGVRFDDGRVVSDPALVRERHEKLAGGITIASPPGFHYERGNPYYAVFASRAGKAALNLLLYKMLRREVTSPRVGNVGGKDGFVGRHPRVAMTISRSPFMTPIFSRRNTDKEASTELLFFGDGDASAGMYVQLFQALIEEHFLEHPGRSTPGLQYDYTSNMSLITLPLLFITGTADFANPRAIRELGYDSVSSTSKEYLNLPGYGHTDLLMGTGASRDVYPRLCEWMESIS